MGLHYGPPKPPVTYDEFVRRQNIKRHKNALSMATAFHETYERLSTEYGYETREDTKVFDPKSKNGRLMIAVCNELFYT